MSVGVFLLALGSLIVFTALLFGLAMISLIRGYQLGHRDASYGLPSAMPWPPLPEGARKPTDARSERQANETEGK